MAGPDKRYRLPRVLGGKGLDGWGRKLEPQGDHRMGDRPFKRDLEKGSRGWKTKGGYPGGPRGDGEAGRGSTRHEWKRELLAGGG